MAIFEYVATDPSGNSVDGTFEAVDETDARNILAQYNLTPTSLNLQGGATVQAAVLRRWTFPRTNAEEIPPASKGKNRPRRKRKKAKAVFLISR